ncbi:hypothetical protein MferCBS31731_004710 [Microsporum ferrugineum]
MHNADLTLEKAEPDIFATPLPSSRQMHPQKEPPFAAIAAPESPVAAKNLYSKVKKRDSSLSIAQEDYSATHVVESDSSSTEENGSQGSGYNDGCHSDQASEDENYVEPNKRAVWLPGRSKGYFDTYCDNISIDGDVEDLEEADEQYEEIDEHYEETDEHYEEADEHYKETDEHYEEADEHYKETDEHYEETDEHYEETDEHYEETDEHYEETDEHYEKTDERYEETDEHEESDVNSAYTRLLNYQTNTCRPRRSSLRTLILSPRISPHKTAEEDVCLQSEDDNDPLADKFREMEDRFQRRQEKIPKPLHGNGIPTLTRSNAFGLKPSPGHNLFKRLLRGFISLPNALESNEDMTKMLHCHRKMEDLYFELGERESEIREVVASHCGLPSPDRVFVSTYDTGETWSHGSFNLCIPVYASYPGSEEPIPLAFKLPLPYMVGEEEFPGNAEERLRTEAATHLWISQNCPEVPIPKLYGFGFRGGISFFKPEYVTIWQRFKTYACRLFHRLFRNSSEFCEYIPQNRTTLLNHGYMLTEWATTDDDLKPLSEKLGMRHNDVQLHFDKFIQKSKTQNLYRSFAKVMMSLAKIPQPRIGSWTIDNNGQLSLSNRPLLPHITKFENWGIPSGIPRETTYTNTDSFYNDCIGVYDNRLEHQRNIVKHEREVWDAAAKMVYMRSYLPRFADYSLRQGPFFMQFGNMPSHNILVDKEWNVKQFIDVQGICSLPIELLLPPPWMTGKDLGNLLSTEKDRLNICYRQFTNTLRHEEAKNPLLPNGKLHSDTLLRTLLSDKFWFLHSLQTPGDPDSMINWMGGYMDMPLRRGSPIAASVFRPYMNEFVGFKLRSYVAYHKDVHSLYDGSHGRVYDDFELSYIERQPVIPRKR